jgi:photosystem II stability/assembly factor-like uncharacterized protein
MSVWFGVADASPINQIALGPGAPPAISMAMGRYVPGYGGALASGVFERFDATGWHSHVFSFANVWSVAADPSAAGMVVLTANDAFEWTPGERPDAWSKPIEYFANYSSILPLSAYFDARFPGVVYAGSGGRVYKSVDGGRTYPTGGFVGDPTVLPQAIVETFLAEPGPSGIFAGTTKGLFVSEDAGGSWIAGSADLSSQKVFALAADASSRTTLWAGTDDGVYESTDSGTHWSKAGATLSGSIAAVLSVAGGGLFAGGDTGLSVSRDGGATWTAVAGITAAVRALAQDPRFGVFAAGTAAGVYESVDGGATWAASNEGLDNPDVTCLAFLEGGGLVAGTGGGVFEQVLAPTGRSGPTPAPSTPRAPIALPERP